MSNDAMDRAWVEVDLDALRANYETIRVSGGEDRRIIAMVKADAYGLGVGRVVRTLEPLAPLAYGVATVTEGLELRGLGVERPVLVFSPTTGSSFDTAAEAGLTLCVSDLAQLERWAESRGSVPPLEVHVEIDTGMGRAGLGWREVADWAPRLAALAEGGSLRWTGVFTHFHGADAADPVATETQWERFRDALGQLPAARGDRLIHAANSAAALRWPGYALDAIRPGIFLYGGDPLAEVPDRAGPTPRTVASVRARIALVREVPPGSTVGYGATHVARSWERWATLGIGYGDGIPRSLGNRGSGVVRGKRVRIVGRISMDMVVVDITDVPEAEVGDVVTLIGEDGGLEITLDEVATQAGTISYEILTGLRPRLPRVER
jgi:alanine racemase